MTNREKGPINDRAQMSSDTEQKLRFEEEAVCEVCGIFGAYLFEGKTLCGECYEASGSCCQESERGARASSKDNKT